MRLRKILFSLLTLTAVGSVATTLITSCSGVSKDILNNMVSLGDDSKFADSIGGNSFDLQHEINIALTDKTATDAFKTSVVNKILKGWFDSLTGIATIDNDKKQWKKDISDDWDNKIQAAKNAHLSNWKYYFQNETLNPVGGTKAKWEQSQWYSKIRDYFVTEITKNNYLAIPQRDASLNKNFYVEDNNGNYLVDFNHPVDYNISGSKITDLLGSGTISSASSADVLNPDWWPTINFYATANKSYTSSSQDQDKSYALIQQMAFEEYTKNVRPLSTGYVLWNYSLPAGKTDLKDIYNNAEINDGGSTAKKSSTDKDKAGDDPAPTPGLLSTPSYAFPYFGEVSPTPTSATGPEDQFRAFATAFNAGNQFLDNRDGVQDSSALGLVDIPIDMDYSAKNDTTLALINQSSNTGTDDTPYETYIAPILDMYYLYETKTTESSYYTNTMPVYYSTSSGTDKSFFPDTTHILKNFLFKNQTDENQPGSSVKTVPTNLDRTDRGGTLDLKNIYRDDSDSNTVDHIALFNPYNHDQNSTWYADGARILVSAMRIANPTEEGSPKKEKPLPYIMIRTPKGVTFMGIDGVDYLAQAGTGQPASDATDLNWRPGGAFSQERENQIIKFRTVYQNAEGVNPQCKGIDIITSSGSSASGPLIDYLKNNLDTIILDAVNRVVQTKGINVDSGKDANKTDYWTDGLLGLKSILPDENGNDIWNAKLNSLVQSFNLLNAFTTIITNVDTNNKKLFAFSNTYRTNALVDKSIEVDGHGPASIYKNGLAMPLPLVIVSGLSTGADDTDLLLAKTNYSVAVKAANHVAETTGLTQYFGNDNKWYVNGSYSKLIADGEKGVIKHYDEWNNSLPTDQRAIQNNKGNKNAYLYDYSENILTYNDYVNDMLWKFGSGNTFSNSIKTAALSQYLNNYIPSDNMKTAITSMYITNKLITNDTPITTYLNSFMFNEGKVQNYATGLWYQWITSLNTNIGSSSLGENGGITNGYTDKVIDWKTYLATIYYLTKDHNAQFIKWLQNKIGSDFQNSTYVVWAAKDNKILNPNFANLTDKPLTIYGWKSNYDGLFDNIYQNTNLTSSGTKSYVAFDQYWQFAPMPLLSDDANAMGYLGLQTKNSNTLDKISASAKAALFDKFSYSGAADHTGSLYQFGSRDKLKEMIEKDLTSPTVAKINQYTDFIQAQTGLFNGVKNQIDKAATLTEKRDILLKGVSAEGPLTDTCFNGYNLNNSSSKALELVNPTGGNTHFIPDSSGSQTGSRITIMQINQYDVKGETNEQITENLQKTLGNDLFDYLVAQAALDPNNQTTTINDVIKTVFNGNKLAVYDRRFNDQLGSQWVKDWKTKN